MLRRLPTVDPRTYQRIAELALVALTLIVFTGAAVRVTGSGLGCPDWPKCYGGIAPPLETHAWIEFGNRMLSTVIGLVALGAGVFAWRRRPFRRDLARLALLLPLGAASQAILGGFTVTTHLSPGLVMAHFGLSMLILIAAVAVVWAARHEPGERPRSTDRVSVWGTRAVMGLGAVTIFFGTVSTAAGPHAGGAGTGDEIDRLEWRGLGTLDWAISQHGRLATLLGVAAVAVFVLARRRRADPQLQRALGVVCVLLGVQGVVGAVQYALEVPAGLVWVHVALATLSWLSLLWATAAAGRLGARPAPDPEPPTPDRALVRS